MSGSQNKRTKGVPVAPAKPARSRVMWDLERSAGDAEHYAPPMDIYEKEDSVTIELELPGVSREDIEVYVSRNLVTIEGVKQGDPSSSSACPMSFLRLERKHGRFFREVELPVPCNTREGTARYERGLLILEFQKISDRRGQRCRIEIK